MSTLHSCYTLLYASLDYMYCVNSPQVEVNCNLDHPVIVVSVGSFKILCVADQDVGVYYRLIL